MSKRSAKPIDCKCHDNNEINNFYEHKDTREFLVEYPNPNFEQNQMKLPFMLAICSSTSGGKTNCLLNIMRRFDNTFTQIYIANSGCEEPLYQLCKKKLKDGCIIVNSLSKLPSLESLEETKDQQKLFVFDDLVKTKNTGYIEQMYLRGRKLGCSCIYISQSFYDIDPFIRKQLHYLILLKLSSQKEAKMIIRSYALGIPPEELLEIYKDATKKHLDFLKIDIRSFDENRIFSKNFTQFYQITP